MKTNRLSRRYYSMATFLFCLAAQIGSFVPAHAHPTTSPSAVAAVRLKYHPPNNWIRHYLGDDRYKIAGNVWKVVSTQMDTYYHRANCPNMLRQPAGIVIGFANWNEAEEGGYVPDAVCAPQANIVSYTAAARNGSGGAGPGGRGGVSAARGTRIVLSDGKSTVILPRGWRYRALESRSSQTQAGAVSSSSDLLSPPSGQGGIAFAFVTVPGNINLEPIVSPQGVERLREQLRQRAGNDAGVARALEGAQVGVGRLGGINGITFIPGKGAQLPAGMGGRMTIVARGSKMYMMAAQLSSKDTNYGVVVNSFQPR